MLRAVLLDLPAQPVEVNAAWRAGADDADIGIIRGMRSQPSPSGVPNDALSHHSAVERERASRAVDVPSAAVPGGEAAPVATIALARRGETPKFPHSRGVAAGLQSVPGPGRALAEAVLVQGPPRGQA